MLQKVQLFKHQMMREFEMSDLGLLSFYLGLEVEQRSHSISIKQSAYAKNILDKARLASCNSCKYPMEPKIRLEKDDDADPVMLLIIEA